MFWVTHVLHWGCYGSEPPQRGSRKNLPTGREGRAGESRKVAEREQGQLYKNHTRWRSSPHRRQRVYLGSVVKMKSHARRLGHSTGPLPRGPLVYLRNAIMLLYKAWARQLPAFPVPARFCCRRRRSSFPEQAASCRRGSQECQRWVAGKVQERAPSPPALAPATTADGRCVAATLPSPYRYQ